MDRSPAASLADHYAAAIDWWREAGVDMDYADSPQAWLAPEEQPAAAPVPQPRQRPAEQAPPPATPSIGGDRAAWPTIHDEFAAWWMAEPSLATSGTRVPPRGKAKADLMVLVPMPEAQDGERLLAGPEGVLVGNMLRAMGIAGDDAYIAAALPIHLPHADWDGLAAQGLSAILQHHVALAAPRRLLVLGIDLLPLLGAEKRQGVHRVPMNGGSMELLGTFAPEYLLGHARARAGLWKRWLEWTVDR